MIKSGLAEKLKSLSENVFFNTGDENDINSFHAQYEVKEELGRGLTSIVCKCVDRFTGEKYAVKIIDINQTCDLDIVDSIVSEVSVLSSLPQHPNVISLFNVYRTDANVYIVLELAPNGELFGYVNKFAVLSEKVTANLFRQLLLGLDHLHSNNIVHRDIKMENVLMNDKLGIKLTDFGFAKKLGSCGEEHENLHDLCGTLSYIAPEMIRAEYGTNPAGYGCEVDMWACGVLLYTLLMGQPPFYHPKQLHLMRQIQECRYDTRSDTWHRLSDPVRSLILGLLQADVRKRLTSHQALQHSWLKHGGFVTKRSYKRNFKQVAYLVLFVVSLRAKSNRTVTEESGNNFQLIRERNVLPYHLREVRAAMDDVAFSIYGQWVQREDPASRAMMFRHRKRIRSHDRAISLNE